MKNSKSDLLEEHCFFILKEFWKVFNMAIKRTHSFVEFTPRCLILEALFCTGIGKENSKSHLGASSTASRLFSSSFFNETGSGWHFLDSSFISRVFANTSSTL